MSLARLKVASLCHVSEVVDYWGEASGKLDANPEYLRDNESGRSYLYNKGLVLVSSKYVPSSHITHERTLKRLLAVENFGGHQRTTNPPLPGVFL